VTTRGFTVVVVVASLLGATACDEMALWFAT
jgi:hypothetical protein